MARAKYFEGIETAQAAQASQRPANYTMLEQFDFTALEGSRGLARAMGALTSALIPPIYAFSRRFMPLLPLAGLLHVTRDAQVRSILQRPSDFIVPFGPEMNELGEGATFLLGLDGEPHDRQHRILMQVIRPDDAARIAAMSKEFTEALLDNSKGSIDVIADLIRRVPAEICLRYYGLSCDDVDAFADWSTALSAFLFGDPYGKPEVRRLAINAQQRLAAVIDDAIVRTQRLVKTGAITDANAATLVARMVLIQRRENLDDAEIRAMILGMVTGFIPTNLLAASNMLMELLKRPDAMAIAQQAAKAGDRATMDRIVMEAGRLNPALAPGQWRYCPRDTPIDIDGKAKTIKAGTTLLVSTMSAMRDPRAWHQPKQFRLDRVNADGTPQEADLVFGIGSHACIGKHLGIAQISEMFIALLKRDALRPAKGRTGKMQRIGPFPRHMMMTYATPASQQSMFLVIAPVTSGASKYGVDKEIAKLGHPAGADIQAALDASGLVHFASLATILSDQAVHIVFELSCDGNIDEALIAIAANAGQLLRPLLFHAGLAEADDILGFMQRHVIELHGKPWGANGLNYNGLPEFPVQQVAKQARFADFAGRVLRDYVATETVRGSHPMLAMAHLRRILRGDPELMAEATPAQHELIAEARVHGYDAFNLSTNAARLQLARYRPKSNLQAGVNFLKSRDGRIVVLPLLALFVVFAFAFWPTAKGPILWKILALTARAAISAALVASAIVGLFLFKLRQAEKADVLDTTQAPLDKLRDIMAQENAPGFAQNHILAVGTMKTGWFRAFTHALALWGIRNLIVYGFRPGFVINMGTIHYARWWRLPGTNKVCFYSNFDGSWESYLEDFITRARQGQTAAWSNWQGFPRTEYMVGLGAQDGDAFKRWVRIQQQIVPFWYARFPELTSDQIRNNAMIHSGAGLARTASESEEWLRCFGSMPRVENRIEIDEVQAIVFRGMKRLPYSANLAIRLPNSREALGEWLSWLRGKAMQPGSIGNAAAIEALVTQGVLVPVPRPVGRPAEYALAHSLTVAFGDRPLTGDSLTLDEQSFSNPEYDKSGGAHKDAKAAASHAVFIGLSAAGIQRFEGRSSTDGNLASSFPYAFRMGMAGRDRIMGDVGVDAPDQWRWGDDPRAGNASEAVLLLYAASPDQLDRLLLVHRGLLENHGGTVLSQTNCAPAFAEPEKADFEHFGYRDGISQPVMRGTSRALRGVAERDIVEPGEFILGYRNGQGFYPPSPLLPPESDIRGALPVAVKDIALSKFPDFGDASMTQGPRDLGRNGSYMVIRELRQDVAAFEAFVDDAAKQLTSGGLCDLYKLVGQHPDRDWVKAKLMGRWPNGRPLVGNPVNLVSRAETIAAETENDFSYGEEDAQGLACPFGAHIRRTNPRDSKQPGDQAEQFISNRHRLLRRGRTYSCKETGEKGLFFVSLCTDIERQFEFVQQFWANAPAFHGLDKEPDPFIGSDPVSAQDGCPQQRVFTIPTAAGPVQIGSLKKYVQTMAGGYFFLPSRSALGWLTDVALHTPRSNVEDAAS